MTGLVYCPADMHGVTGDVPAIFTSQVLSAPRRHCHLAAPSYAVASLYIAVAPD